MANIEKMERERAERRKAMEEMVQLNQGQKYSYSREQLIEMLDAAMAANP